MATDSKTRGFLPKTWDLPPAIRRRLGDQAGRQRLMDEDGHLLLILHEPPHPQDDEVRRPVLFWRNPAGDWRCSTGGFGIGTLETHLQAFRAVMQDLDNRVEAAKRPREFFDVMRAIPALHRTSRNLLAVMEAARQARPQEARLISLRDLAVDIERGMELLAHDARNGMDFALAESGEAQAREARDATREARRLNRLAAFFFPLATMAAIFGMNRPDEVLRTPGVWAVLGSGIAAGFLLGRRAREKRPAED